MISTPLAWYPRLVHGSAAEHAKFELIGNGEGIHQWPDLDEDLSIEGMLAGQPSREKPGSIERWLARRKKTKKITDDMAQRKSIDCRDYPSEKNCSLKISGTEEEVLDAAVQHAASVHGHENTPELREQIKSMLKDERD